MSKAGKRTEAIVGISDTTEILPNNFWVKSTVKATPIAIKILWPVFCSLIGPNKKDIAKITSEKVIKGCRTFLQNSRDNSFFLYLEKVSLDCIYKLVNERYFGDSIWSKSMFSSGNPETNEVLSEE